MEQPTTPPPMITTLAWVSTSLAPVRIVLRSVPGIRQVGLAPGDVVLERLAPCRVERRLDVRREQVLPAIQRAPCRILAALLLPLLDAVRVREGGLVESARVVRQRVCGAEKMAA